MSKFVTTAARRISNTALRSSQPLQFTFTSHPVANNPEFVIGKEGSHIANRLEHEISHYARAIGEVIKNSAGQNVVYRSWNYSDCDRHPDQKPGIITLGAMTMKLTVMQSLGIEMEEGLESRIQKIQQDLRDNFDLGKNAKDYREILDQDREAIEKLNRAWIDNSATIDQVWQGSDYRISGSDASDPKAAEVIKQTLHEIFEDEPEIKRLVIADCDGEEQIDAVKDLLKSMNLEGRLSIVPLFEDRVQAGAVKEIIEKFPEIETIQIAGSDSKRRIGYVGLLNLVMDISTAIEESGRDIKIFVGSGNTHWRAEDLISLVPQQREVERTVQGQLVFSMEDAQFTENFLAEQQSHLRSRPSNEEVESVRDFFVALDEFQETTSHDAQNDPIFRKLPIDLILNNSKFFGSRHKPNKFSESDSLSELDLLERTRAIEHTWIYKLTGMPSPEIVDLYNIIQNDELRAQLLEKKDNPYVMAVIKSALKGMHYCDEEIARKYCVSDEVCEQNFAKLRAVQSFINENFREMDSAQLVRRDLKLYSHSDEEFAETWQKFGDFRRSLADLVTTERSELGISEQDRKQAVNKMVKDYYILTPQSISQVTGRTFSTQRELPSRDHLGIAKCLANISDLFSEAPPVIENSKPKQFCGLGSTTVFKALASQQHDAVRI